jgi:hypothetical protein
VLIRGLPDEVTALCLEWAIKHVRTSKGNPLSRRITAIKTLLQRDWWTRKCNSVSVTIECRRDLVHEFQGLKWVNRVVADIGKSFLHTCDVEE